MKIAGLLAAVALISGVIILVGGDESPFEAGLALRNFLRDCDWRGIVGWTRICLLNPPVRQHALVEDAVNHNPLPLHPVENHMPAFFDPAQSGTNFIACAPQHRILDQPLHAVLNAVEIPAGLSFAPGPERIFANSNHIRAGLRGPAAASP